MGVGWMIVMWIIHTTEVLGEGKIKAAVKQVGKFLKRCHCQSAGTTSAGVLHIRHRATGVRSDRIFPSLKIKFETQKCLWRLCVLADCWSMIMAILFILFVTDTVQ